VRACPGWPNAELKIIEDDGHTGSPTMSTAIADAIAHFTYYGASLRSGGSCADQQLQSGSTGKCPKALPCT
jgi:hypothetical protein